MEGRLEFKYLVPNALLEPIRADLRPYMASDPLGGQQRRGEYTVRSIYYDSPRLHCYYDKEAGLKVRKKFRIRGYDSPTADSVVFLEIKRKYAGFIEKHRSPLLRANLESFLASADIDRYILQASGTARERRDAELFVYHYYRHGLVPAVLVVYDRAAFLGRFDRSLRMTFDMNLRGATFPALETLYEEHDLESAMKGYFIFEVKFFRNALPAFVRAIITRYGLPRLALSKFAICLDSGRTTPISTYRTRAQFVGASRTL